MAALGLLLSRAGTRVHLVDTDPQASLTHTFGHQDDTDGLYNALTDRLGFPIQTVFDNLSLTPSTIEFARAETELLAETTRKYYQQTAPHAIPVAEEDTLIPVEVVGVRTTKRAGISDV